MDPNLWFLMATGRQEKKEWGWKEIREVVVQVKWVHLCRQILKK